MIIHTPLAITVVAVATVSTMIFIGLGHLPKPTRATAIWSAAFATAMAGTFIWIGADSVDSLQLRGAATGLIFGAMFLLWSGNRSFRGVSPKLGVSVSLLALMSLSLFAAAFTNYYSVTFRAVTAVVAIFAALAIAELLRLGPSVRDAVTPFVAVGALCIIFACIAVIDGVLVATGEKPDAESLDFVRGINMIGANVLIICALVTLLLLATRDETVRTSSSSDIFERVAGDRLERARAIGDDWWSFIDIRLDDPDDIRIATSTAVFNDVCERFYQEVSGALPADADIQRMSPTRIIALVPRAQGGMRQILSEVLQRISSTETSSALPVRLSASVGWAHASTAEYDFDTLLEIAANASRAAHEAGGDRWERVHGDVKPA